MAEAVFTLTTAKEIAGHVVKWLVNLRRASDGRKLESQRAVNKVVTLSRRTMAYSRGLKAGEQNFNVEADLAASWSDLSFDLKELKLDALAKKCDLKSRYWADPEQFSPGFLADADIGFESVERLARTAMVKLKVGSRQ